MKESGENLVKLIREGNERACHLLFNEYYAILSVFAKKYTSDLDSAKDIVQDVFVKIYEQISQFEIHTSLKSYLYQLVRNLSLNYLKHVQIDQKHKSNILNASTEEYDWGDKILEIELEEKIFEIVSALPKQCQNIFIRVNKKPSVI